MMKTKISTIFLIFVLFIFTAFSNNTEYQNLSTINFVSSNYNENLYFIDLIIEMEMDEDNPSRLLLGVYDLASTDNYTVKSKEINDINYNLDYSLAFKSSKNKIYNLSKNLDNNLSKVDPNIKNRNYKNDFSYNNNLNNKIKWKSKSLDLITYNLFNTDNLHIIEIQKNVFIFSWFNRIKLV